jgi:hypothetical protein
MFIYERRNVSIIHISSNLNNLKFVQKLVHFNYRKGKHKPKPKEQGKINQEIITPSSTPLHSYQINRQMASRTLEHNGLFLKLLSLPKQIFCLQFKENFIKNMKINHCVKTKSLLHNCFSYLNFSEELEDKQNRWK